MPKKDLPLSLSLQPVAAAFSGLILYALIAEFLPGFLQRIFVPAIDGHPPAVTANALAGPLFFVGLLVAALMFAHAFYLWRKVQHIRKAWETGAIPACPLCGALMKRRGNYWRCYDMPACSGHVDANGTGDDSGRRVKRMPR